MALDERDHHSYNLPEAVKEARLQQFKKRLDRATTPTTQSHSIEDLLPRTPVGALLFLLAFCFLLATGFYFLIY